MLKSGLTLLLFLFATLAFAQSSKEATVWANVDALNKAIFETKDSVTLNQLVSDKVTYGHSGGNLEDKKTMVHNAVVSTTIYKNRSTEHLVIFFVKNTAIARHIFRATSVEKGVETSLNLGVLQVWTKEHNKWKIIARQAVKINPK